MTTPSVPITDPSFQYTSAADTDIGKRFAKLRREPVNEDEAQQAAWEHEERVLNALTVLWKMTASFEKHPQADSALDVLARECGVYDQWRKRCPV